MIPTADKRAAFRRLHQSGCFLLPNPWDVGGARLLAGMGFKALASTSAGAAWSMGRPDGGAGLDDILDHLRVLAAATDLPLNADFENGFADAPGAVAAHVAMAVETGVSGLSIEDATGRPDEPIYGFDLAVARVAAARAAIDQGGSGVLLTARAESFLRTKGDLADVVARLKAFAAAGADVLYAPGLPDLDAVRAVVAAAGPLPVNAIIPGPGVQVADLAAHGVRRVSVGTALARASWGAFVTAARQLSGDGAFQPFAPITPFTSLNAAFATD